MKKNSQFDKIVRKLSKRQWTIISVSDISEYHAELLENGRRASQSTYNSIARLKREWWIEPVSNGQYLVLQNLPGSPTGKSASTHNGKRPAKDFDAEWLAWKSLHSIIQREFLWNGCIVGKKAIEIHLKDYSDPDTFYVICRWLTATKTRKLADGCNVKFLRAEEFGQLVAFASHVTLYGKRFLVAGPELALLDALISRRRTGDTEEQRSAVSVVKRYLKRFSDTISRDVMGKLVSFRYVTAANRLKAIAQSQWYDGLYRDLLDVIYREGKGCFLTVDGTTYR